MVLGRALSASVATRAIAGPMLGTHAVKAESGSFDPIPSLSCGLLMELRTSIKRMVSLTHMTLIYFGVGPEDSLLGMRVWSGWSFLLLEDDRSVRGSTDLSFQKDQHLLDWRGVVVLGCILPPLLHERRRHESFIVGGNGLVEGISLGKLHASHIPLQSCHHSSQVLLVVLEGVVME